MGLLSRRQRYFESFSIEIYEDISTTKRSLIEKNGTEIRTNTINLEANKEILTKDLARLVSEMPEENEFIELEWKVREALSDISAILLETWSYLKINGPSLHKELFYPDLEPENLTEFEESEESKELHRKLFKSDSSMRNKKDKSSEKLEENAVFETRMTTKTLNQEQTLHVDNIDIGLEVSTLSSPKSKNHNPNRKSLYEITEDTSRKEKPKEIVIKESRKKVVNQIDNKAVSTRDISYTQATCRKYTRFITFIGPEIKKTFSKLNIQNLITTLLYLYFTNYLLLTLYNNPCKTQNSSSSHIKIFISNSRQDYKSIHNLKLNCFENKNSKNFKYCYLRKKSSKLSQAQSINRSKENIVISTNKEFKFKFKYDKSETIISSNKGSVLEPISEVNNREGG